MNGSGASGRVIQLLDGYTDDPAALGVPPFISPIVRAVAGAAIDAGYSVEYITIDMLRLSQPLYSACEFSVVASGNTVPGRYLRSLPASEREILHVLPTMSGIKIGNSSSVRLGPRAGFDYISSKDLAAMVFDLLTGRNNPERHRTLDEWNRWMLLGSGIVKNHQDYPQPLVAEVETYRGCHRHSTGGCSYCIEPEKGPPLQRRPQSVIEEAELLRRHGVRNIRVGGQTCIISYGSDCDDEVPKPNPGVVRELFEGLRDLEFNVLHVDNANPAVISTYPEESREILEILRDCCTSGNVLALGMESADHAVIEANNLNAYPEQVLDAVRLINEVGSDRGENGMPKILPGINIISGLGGERAETYYMNLDFLRKVRDEGLMLRRINIRQVIPVRREFSKKVNPKQFRRFKKQVREEIDHVMLKSVVPYGAVLKNVYTEIHDGSVTFGRQIGSYPLLVGIPYKVNLEEFHDVIVIGWGYRSITALQYPFPINDASASAISSLPGIGKKRAATIMRNRPYETFESLASALDDRDVAEKLRPFLDL